VVLGVSSNLLFPHQITMELFPMFSLPAPQFSLELIRDGLRVTEVSPLPLTKGRYRGVKTGGTLVIPWTH